MSKKKMRPIDKFFSAFITFPKVSKSVKERKTLFDKIVLLLENNKDSFPEGLILKKGKNKVILDSDDFMFSIELKEQLSTRIMINEPDKNIIIVNKVSNSIINFLNTVLEERAKGANIFFSKLLFSEKPINYASKIIGTTQLAKVNEVAKENITPFVIALEYEKEKRKYVISSSFSKKVTQNIFAVQMDCDDKLPFDLLQNENERLNDPINLLKKITNAEL